MKNKKIGCPLCGKHKISTNQILDYLKFSYNQVLSVTTIETRLCPAVKEKIKDLECIADVQINQSLKISIYKITDDDFRIIFYVTFKERHKIKKEKRASFLHSIDTLTELIDELKIIVLTYQLYALKKNKLIASKLKEAKVDLNQFALEAANQTVKPLYKAVRGQRGGINDPD